MEQAAQAGRRTVSSVVSPAGKINPLALSCRPELLPVESMRYSYNAVMRKPFQISISGIMCGIVFFSFAMWFMHQFDPDALPFGWLLPRYFKRPS